MHAPLQNAHSACHLFVPLNIIGSESNGFCEWLLYLLHVGEECIFVFCLCTIVYFFPDPPLSLASPLLTHLSFLMFFERWQEMTYKVLTTQTKKILWIFWGGRMVWRCCVSYVTRASNWYWLTLGQGLLSFWQVRVEGECFYFLRFFTFIPVPLSSLFLSFISSYLFFSFSLGDNTKWLARVDVSLSPNTILWIFLFYH